MKAILLQALDALEYHTAQTRPIERTNDAIKAIKEALTQVDRLPPKEEKFSIATKWLADKAIKEKRDAEWRSHGICPECEGLGEQGSQYAGGYWDCDACNGTGKV